MDVAEEEDALVVGVTVDDLTSPGVALLLLPTAIGDTSTPFFLLEEDVLPAADEEEVGATGVVDMSLSTTRPCRKACQW